MPNYEPKPATLKQREFLVKWLHLPHSSIDLLSSGAANMVIQCQTAVWNAEDANNREEMTRLTTELHRTLAMVLALAIEEGTVADDESADESFSSEELEWIEA